MTTKCQPSTLSISLQLYQMNQDKYKPQNIYKTTINDDLLEFDPGKKSRIELKSLVSNLPPSFVIALIQWLSRMHLEYYGTIMLNF